MDKLTVGFRKTSAYEKAASFCRERGLLPPGSRVLLALSGGADSVFALMFLLALSEEEDLHVGAFHLNHMIRGEEADRDENFCRELCGRLGVPFTAVRRDIPSEAKAALLSEESMGRKARYEYMESVRDRFERAVTAHHMDDCAESILMHIIRGSGLRGLAGISPLRDGWIARPLVCLGRDEIVSALESLGIQYVNDSTNAMRDYSRNRVRMDIMPLLERENPRIREALVRLSETAGDYLESARREALAVPLGQRDGRVCCSFEGLRSLSAPARYELVSSAASMLGRGRDISRASIEALGEMMDSPSTAWKICLSGVVCERSYSDMIFGTSMPSGEAAAFLEPLTIPGTTRLPGGGCLRCSFVQKIEKNPGEGMVTFIDYDKIKGLPLARSRREADSFTPVGMKGTKSVRRFFIDRKLPRDQRALYPLICDGEGVAAIPGMACSERCKVTEGTVRVLRIEYSVSGED
ncbi:MAG: tRNA lysidine(34) synthetase TilS [Eubacteriaceae bacterium]|nr:tRNA lysidine(34) synthetase TilS [Eubacteriaceae bacterium]